MVERGTGPENALLIIDLFVGNAVIVRQSSTRSEAQFIENLARLAKRKELAPSETPRQFADDFRIRARIGRRVHGFLDMDYARFHAGGYALFFLLQAAGENDIGVGRGFREEEIDDAKEFQFFEGLTGERSFRKRNQWIETDGKQTFDFAGVNGVHDLDSAIAGLGQLFRRNALSRS